ncbi:MAG: stage V sporulation protein B [Bacillota bacterium]
MRYSQSMLTGTLVLVTASVVNRFLGFIYQIFLIRLIRAEGIGLFTMVYPIYVLALVLASMGIPVAIAKLVSDAVTRHDTARAYQILRLSLLYTIISSFTVTLIGFTSARFITGQVLSNPATLLPFLCLLPGVLIVSVCSVFRGFFQGLQNMTPTAVSQGAEQLTRVLIGLLLASFLIHKGVLAAACGASLGAICGEFFGFVLMLGFFLRHRRLLPRTPRLSIGEAGFLTREIFGLALPITLMRFVSTGFLSLEAILIPHRLIGSGYSMQEATGIYGQFAGIAETMLYTPGLITVSLSTVLVPAIAEALAARNSDLLGSRINNALRLTFLTGLPSAVVLFLLPEDLCRIIFGYPNAGAALRVLALGAPFLYLQQTTTGILQGLGRPMVPFRNLVTASVFKAAGIYFLTGIPVLGIKGAAASVVCAFCIMSIFNLYNLIQLTGCTVSIKEVLLKPLTASLAGAVVLNSCHNYFTAHAFQPAFNLLLSIFLMAIVYFCALIVIGGFSRQDRQRFTIIFCKIFTAIKR